MPALRNVHRLARLVLAWFALSLGVAMASPLVTHAGVEVVCSGSSIKLVVKGGVDSKTAGHTLDCPLCAGLDAPPPVASIDIPYAPLLGRALQPIPSARIAALAFASLPARGPPPIPIA